MKDKVLVVIVTHNNPVLLQHMFDSIDKKDAGCEYDIVVVDASSDKPQQLKLLDKLAKRNNVTVEVHPDDRVEANYNVAWRNHKDYRHYFFSHDDMCIIANNWLQAFIDRMNSGYAEDIIKKTHLTSLPIGKVCVGTQFWRSYTSVMNFPVQCVFLQEVLQLIRPKKYPSIFKYCDGDRVLISHECMEATQGFRHVGDFKILEKEDPETFKQVCQIFDKYLKYFDVGGFPRDVYPQGQYWAKFALTGEMMSSIDPLIQGYRSVGLKDDGYLEQLHGFDVPMQHDHITHYGSPNFRTFIAKQLNCDKDDVKKQFNNKAFLLTMDKIYQQYRESLNV